MPPKQRETRKKVSKDINRSYLGISNGFPNQGISINDAGNMQCKNGVPEMGYEGR